MLQVSLIVNQRVKEDRLWHNLVEHLYHIYLAIVWQVLFNVVLHVILSLLDVAHEAVLHHHTLVDWPQSDLKFVLNFPLELSEWVLLPLAVVSLDLVDLDLIALQEVLGIMNLRHGITDLLVIGDLLPLQLWAYILILIQGPLHYRILGFSRLGEQFPYVFGVGRDHS